MEGNTLKAPCCAVAGGTAKRSKSSIYKSRRNKDNNRSVEDILKTLNGIPDSLKLGTLAVRYNELDDVHRTCEVSISALEKQCLFLQKEKEQLKSENGKQILARTHLEGLCRELYRLNKMVKDDSVSRLREEEDRRKEITSKFESTLNEVTNMMQENSVKNDKLRDDNLHMASKMKVLYKEFENRKEEQLRLDQQLDLERQLTQVQIEKAKLEIQAERALWEEERTSLTEKWKISENSCTELQLIVEDLRKRMETYEERNLGYKSAIDSNSKFFETCKTEIRSMNKKVTLLDKELLVWKERSQQNALKAMDISLVKQAQDAQLATALKQVESLQSLCRQLQNDRSSYLKMLEAKGIDPDTQKTSLKEEMQLSQKELLLKPIWNQLNLIRLKCVAKKDQMSLNALQRLIEESKSRDSVNSAINLILGFINFKCAAKRAGRHNSMECMRCTYTVGSNYTIAQNDSNTPVFDLSSTKSHILCSKHFE